MIKHLIHHTKHAVRHVRQKPHAVRMHYLRFATLACMFLVVLLWVSLLKRQLQPDPAMYRESITTKNLIQEQVVRVYSESTDNTKP